MQTELKFTFDGENDSPSEEIKTLMNASSVINAVGELQESIRMKLKHGHTYKTADEVLEWFHEELIEIQNY